MKDPEKALAGSNSFIWWEKTGFKAWGGIGEGECAPR